MFSLPANFLNRELLSEKTRILVSVRVQQIVIVYFKLGKISSYFDKLKFTKIKYSKKNTIKKCNKVNCTRRIFVLLIFEIHNIELTLLKPCCLKLVLEIDNFER
ncbi:hypothetical protein BpHYR1_008117 [Brachionus plicatilis]|uniref:Uncharacterized protein n=1 Tax=Brachionus plicatilis TaxID=10195 RepID=A0A3M7R661_BRAPC|nr:hypothetical protein BpHYR1_008117 [Brachionus plicatilis]